MFRAVISGQIGLSECQYLVGVVTVIKRSLWSLRSTTCQTAHPRAVSLGLWCDHCPPQLPGNFLSSLWPLL